MLTSWASSFFKISFLLSLYSLSICSLFYFLVFFYNFFEIDGDMIQKYGGATAATISPFVVEYYRMVDYEYLLFSFLLSSLLLFPYSSLFFFSSSSLLSPSKRYNHPSIVQWEVFNEGDCVGVFNAPQMVQIALDLDPSRLIDTNSGGPANGLYIANVNDIPREER